MKKLVFMFLTLPLLLLILLLLTALSNQNTRTKLRESPLDLFQRFFCVPTPYPTYITCPTYLITSPSQKKDPSL